MTKYIFLLLVLISSYAKADSFAIYESGHPVTGKQGTVLSSATLRNCLIVSFRDLDGNQRLDALQVSNSSSTYVDTRSYGNLLEDQANLIPDANLKAPKDLSALNGHVLWWSYGKLYTASLKSNCSFDTIQDFSLADSLNSSVGRFSTANHMLSNRRAISDQELNELLANGATADQIEDAIINSGIYDIAQPSSPFLAAFGSRTGILRNGDLERFSLKLNGASAIANLNKNGALDLSVYTPDPKQSHFSAFFNNRLNSIYQSASLDKPISDLRNTILSSDSLNQLLNQAALSYLFEASGFNVSETPLDALKKLSAPKVKIRKVLAKYKLKDSSTVKDLVEALVNSNLASYDASKLEVNVKQKLSSSVASLFFSNPTLDLLTLKAKLQAEMTAEYEAQGLANYLVNTLLAPLSGDLPLLKVKFSEVLDGITNNPVGNLLDNSLTALDFALPDEVFLGLFLNAPQCLNIPGSARAFIDLALVTSGPKLDPNGLALFELIKLVEYYAENDSYNRLLTELDQKIRALHSKIAEELVTELTRGINFQGDLNVSIQGIVNEYVQVKVNTVSLNANVSNLILDYLSKRGIKSNTKLSKILIAAAKASKKKKKSAVISSRLGESVENKRAAKKPTLSKADKKLIDGLTFVQLTNYLKPKKAHFSFGIILADSVSSSVLDIANLPRAVDEMLSGLFGDISLDLSLRSIATHFIRSKIDHNLIANFVSETVGSALGSMANNSGGFPIGLKKAWRSLHGDCLAQWQTALDTAAAAALVAQLDLVAADFFLSEQLLSEALNYGTKFVVQQLLSTFFEGIFTQSAGSYPRWHLNLKKNDYNFNISALSGVNARLNSLYSFKDKLVLIQRNNGVSLPEPGASAEVIATIFNLSGAKSVVSLGNWNTVSVTGGKDGFIFLNGEHAVHPTLLLDFRDGTLKSTNLGEKVPLAHRRPGQINVLSDSRILLENEVTGLYVLDLK